MNKKEFYDVALSFADEDRQIVEILANNLRNEGFNLFYDNFEKHELWGKDLSVTLPEKYNQSKFCIMFISDFYLSKMWTTLERQTIIAKFLKKSGNDYLLPVRLDGCKKEVPGLSELVGFIHIDSKKESDVLIALTTKVLKTRLSVEGQK